jgi:hypothetical protein
MTDKRPSLDQLRRQAWRYRGAPVSYDVEDLLAAVATSYLAQEEAERTVFYVRRRCEFVKRRSGKRRLPSGPAVSWALTILRREGKIQ